MGVGRLKLEGTGRERKFPPLLPNAPQEPPPCVPSGTPFTRKGEVEPAGLEAKLQALKIKTGKRKAKGEVVRS